MTAHGHRGCVLTDYVQVTHAARSSGRNGNTSMEIQHVNAVSRQKIPRTCCNAPSLHDPEPWMTFQSSTTQRSLAWKDGGQQYHDTMMMILNILLFWITKLNVHHPLLHYYYLHYVHICSSSSLHAAFHLFAFSDAD